MGEDLLRAFNEEAVGEAGRLKQRCGDRFCFGLPLQLIRRAPVGTARVERVEYYVAAPLVKELLNELASRIVHDGAVVPFRHLQQD